MQVERPASEPLRTRPPGSRAAPPATTLQWTVGLSTVYESNLERRHRGLESMGVLLSAGAGVRTGAAGSVVSVDYDYALHRYELGDRWDRAAHTGRVALSSRLGSAVILAATAEYASGRSSEDSEIGTEYSVLPRIEVRPDARHRIRLQGGYRKRRFGDLSGSNADNQLLGLDYRLGASRRPALQIASRYDANTTEEPRNRFQRWSHTARFTIPIAAAGEVAFEVRQSTRRYPDRLLHMEPIENVGAEGIEWLSAYHEANPGWPGPGVTQPDDRWRTFPRIDEIWSPAVGIALRTPGGIELDLYYTYETRLSNDLRKGYGAHTTRLSTRLRR